MAWVPCWPSSRNRGPSPCSSPGLHEWRAQAITVPRCWRVRMLSVSRKTLRWGRHSRMDGWPSGLTGGVGPGDRDDRRIVAVGSIVAGWAHEGCRLSMIGGGGARIVRSLLRSIGKGVMEQTRDLRLHELSRRRRRHDSRRGAGVA